MVKNNDNVIHYPAYVILGIIIVTKKVTNKVLRYFITSALIVIAIIVLLIMILAIKSGEM